MVGFLWNTIAFKDLLQTTNKGMVGAQIEPTRIVLVIGNLAENFFNNLHF
jgi:hypothetical protein